MAMQPPNLGKGRVFPWSFGNMFLSRRIGEDHLPLLIVSDDRRHDARPVEVEDHVVVLHAGHVLLRHVRALIRGSDAPCDDTT